MKIVTFNVNGIKSIYGKLKDGKKVGDCSFATNVLSCLIREKDPDVICLQEIRCQDTSIIKNYRTTHPFIYGNHSKAKKGYSGTAILSKMEPLRVSTDFERFPEAVPADLRAHEMFLEGRMVTAEFEKVYVISVYTPNSKDGLVRLPDRLKWDACFRAYISALQATGKPVAACGDFNVALEEKDIYNPKRHVDSAGFSASERSSFGQLLKDTELLDTFRMKHPDQIKYTFWSNLYRARDHNRGWRIDYILVSSSLREKVTESEILNDFYGSDHCPVITSLDL